MGKLFRRAELREAGANFAGAGTQAQGCLVARDGFGHAALLQQRAAEVHVRLEIIWPMAQVPVGLVATLGAAKVIVLPTRSS